MRVLYVLRVAIFHSFYFVKLDLIQYNLFYQI